MFLDVQDARILLAVLGVTLIRRCRFSHANVNDRKLFDDPFLAAACVLSVCNFKQFSQRSNQLLTTRNVIWDLTNAMDTRKQFCDRSRRGTIPLVVEVLGLRRRHSWSITHPHHLASLNENDYFGRETRRFRDQQIAKKRGRSVMGVRAPSAKTTKSPIHVSKFSLRSAKHPIPFHVHSQLYWNLLALLESQIVEADVDSTRKIRKRHQFDCFSVLETRMCVR